MDLTLVILNEGRGRPAVKDLLRPEAAIGTDADASAGQERCFPPAAPRASGQHDSQASAYEVL